MKYLLKDGDLIYTVVDEKLVIVDCKEVTYDTFDVYGINELPSTSLILSLELPELLCWNENDVEVVANVSAIPPLPQIQTSFFIPFDETIESINNVVVTGSDDILLRFSFSDLEEEDLWQVWNANTLSWNVASDDEWNTKGDVENAKGYPSKNGYKIQIKYTTIDSFINSIKVNYINAVAQTLSVDVEKEVSDV